MSPLQPGASGCIFRIRLGRLGRAYCPPPAIVWCWPYGCGFGCDTKVDPGKFPPSSSTYPCGILAVLFFISAWWSEI